MKYIQQASRYAMFAQKKYQVATRVDSQCNLKGGCSVLYLVTAIFTEKARSRL